MPGWLCVFAYNAWCAFLCNLLQVPALRVDILLEYVAVSDSVVLYALYGLGGLGHGQLLDPGADTYVKSLSCAPRQVWRERKLTFLRAEVQHFDCFLL